MDIRRITIVEYENTDEFKEATIYFKTGETKTINKKADLREYVTLFCNQTGVNYEELVSLKLVEVKKIKKQESLGGTLRVGNLCYDLVRYLVPSKKLDWGTEKRVILIADIHDYTKYREKADALAKAIKSRKPSHVVVAGDNIQGKKWEKDESIRSFKRFLDNVSEVSPALVSQGNHDLVGINSSNVNERIRNFKSLEHGGRVHALVNDRVFIDGFEIIGYTPTPGIISSNSERESGIAHDKFIREYHERGVKPVKSDRIIEFVGHNPHLIARSANGVGLEDLVPVDVFLTGHLHNGYRKSDTIKANPDKYLDRGYVERGVYKNPDGSIGGISPAFALTDLCRGVVYVDNRAQQRYLQLRNNHFYINRSSADNEQVWIPVKEEDARNAIINKGLHALVITGGIRKFFGFDLKGDKPEITEVVYKGTKR